ncbi:transcriptional regulator [Lactococcus lactis subsp. lactis]|uniref:Transcriptional regulator n=1 Tax=Lactococcus lactis subsp. lactis TaxID=1360 RepID=A0A2Z3KJR0_LACLL|nr:MULTISPECIES: metalloregulator ArsR/SmtB family transcription factor [Lactococcus]AWN65824.1 transcriptional regulator [Lactococcus lactis subsp. lactis]MBK0028762.1 winged helix-turn-helix transcriptional regulator [Lactococcus sp. S47]
MNQNQKRLKLIHGLSNETRLQVLEILKEGENTVSELMEKIGCNQSNLSQHLSCLKECGFIVSHQSGKYVYYSLANTDLFRLLNIIDETIYDMHWSKNEEIECATHII